MSNIADINGSVLQYGQIRLKIGSQSRTVQLQFVGPIINNSQLLNTPTYTLSLGIEYSTCDLIRDVNYCA